MKYFLFLLIFFVGEIFGVTYNLSSGTLPSGCIRVAQNVTCSNITLAWNDKVVISSLVNWQINGFANFQNAEINKNKVAELNINITGILTTNQANIAADINSSSDVVLGHQTVYSGDITANNVTLLASNVEFIGNINASSNVVIGHEASVIGSVSGYNVTLLPAHSTVSGDVVATNSLVMGHECEIGANVTSPSIVIQSSNGFIAGNAYTSAITLGWHTRVKGTIFCNNSSSCSCVTNNSGYTLPPNAPVCGSGGGGGSSAQIDAWESSLSSSNRKIYTKVAGLDFNIRVGAFASDGVTPQPITAQVIVTPVNADTLASIGNGVTVNFNNASSVSATVTAQNAAKVARLQFVKIGTASVCTSSSPCYSSATFSVRPASFSGIPNATYTAGDNINIDLAALNYLGAQTTGYSGTVNISAALNTIGKTNCTTLTAMDENLTFSGGAYSGSVKFSDVGNYNVSLLDNTFAFANCNAASASNSYDASGFVGCDVAATQSATSNIADFVFNIKDFAQRGFGYTLYLKDGSSGLSSMNASFEGNVSAVASDAAVAKNYANGCYANAATLILNAPSITNTTLAKHDYASAGILDFNVGVFDLSNIYFNYIASSQSPIQVNNISCSQLLLSVTDGAIGKTSSCSDFEDENKTANFLYARLTVPTQTYRCAALPCTYDAFKLYEEVYSLSKNALPSPLLSSQNGANWYVLAENTQPNYTLSAAGSFSLLAQPLGLPRVFGVSATIAPSTAVISANTTNTPWFKYKTQTIGKVIFELSNSQGWVGTQDFKDSGVILKQGLPSGAKGEKLNR